LQARISKLRSSLQGLQNVGEGGVGMERSGMT